MIKNLRIIRQKTGKTQKEVSQETNIGYKRYNSYETGVREPDAETLSVLANYFGVSVDYLLGRTDNNSAPPADVIGIEPLPVTKKVPLLGNIACGEPILAEENIERYVDVADRTDCDFALRCKGDSMIGARILDGDLVFIKQQPMVENGEIAAVLINCEATLKRVYYYPERNKLVLNAENPQYEPLVYAGTELDEIRIIGKAVAFQSKVV